MDSATSTIRTPDQRLRIFVSSTLGELSAERAAVRAAIERLRLAPVMFELGARPHPPQDLYRAYLEQSDVFVGLYWESYGWVAPGDSISGLEDEYLLSGSLPKLIYLKKPADGMQPRLRELLDRIRSASDAAYKSFETPEELGELVEGDLATLLAERFVQSRRRTTARTDETELDGMSGQTIPTPLTPLLGRDDDERRVLELLGLDNVRLVTLVGPGGMGKSRLAIDVAHRCSDLYPGGVAFVPLAAIRNGAQVPVAIAQAIGVRDTGVGSVQEKLVTAVRGRTMLLVLDNFEQVQDAAPALTDLLSAAPGLTFLVTSRALLRVGGEHAFQVGPLAVPARGRTPTLSDALASPAVRLFVERARAVQPDFELTDDNVSDVAQITEALDGVPLAIELAAARIRMLPPAAMLPRLDRQLPLLTGGIRDLPERQRAIRNTIEWSVGMLSAEDRKLLCLLGVFSGPFSLEAVEAMAVGDDIADPLTSLGTLVDHSLVQQHDRHGQSFFSILSIVRECSLEHLVNAGELVAASARHAAYYVELGARLESGLRDARQREYLDLLANEHGNLRATMRYLLDERDWTTAAGFAWSLYLYWWIAGHLGEVRGWMDEVLDSGDPLDDVTRATALYFRHAITFWQDPDGSVLRGLMESAQLFGRANHPIGEALARISVGLGLLAAATPQPEDADDTLETALGLFRSASDSWGEAMALVTIGRVSLLSQQTHAALNRFDEALRVSREVGDELGASIAVNHLGWVHTLLGDIDLARDEFTEGLSASMMVGHEEGIAYGLEGLVATAAVSGDIPLAGTLLGASETLRQETGLYNAPSFSFHELMIAPIVGGPQADEFAAARARGRTLSVSEAVALTGAGVLA